jgi:hypothetical protein
MARIVAIVAVGVAVVVVAGVTGAHKAGHGSPHPWLSALIAGGIYAVVATTAIRVGMRRR